MTRTIVIVSLAHPAGDGNFQPGDIHVGSGENFDEAIGEVRSNVAASVRFDDAKVLRLDKDAGTVQFHAARGKLFRYGSKPGELVCPACGSKDVKAARGGEDPEWLTCERNCYGSGGNLRWMFEGHLDPDGEGPDDQT